MIGILNSVENINENNSKDSIEYLSEEEVIKMVNDIMMPNVQKEL